MWQKIVEATNDDMVLALCVLDNKSYKHTLKICNIYCSATASIVTRERLNVILYVISWLVLLSLNIKVYLEIFSS
jgi:hypothetical protein